MRAESTVRVDGIATPFVGRVDHGRRRASYAPRVRTVTEIRRQRLLELIRDYADGNAAAFGRLIDKSRAQVGFWTAAPGKPNAKGIGHATARAFEERFSKPTGWMDSPPDEAYLGPKAPSLVGPTPLRESQPEQLDVDRLGIALTAMDKALADVPIQGRLGKLAAVLLPIYEEAAHISEPDDPSQRALFDAFVREKLRGWDDGEGLGTREGADRTASAAGTKARRRAR